MSDHNQAKTERIVDRHISILMLIRMSHFTKLKLPKQVKVNSVCTNTSNSWGKYRKANSLIGQRQFCSIITDLEKRRKRSMHHSKQRGMLENDLILGSFADKYLSTLQDPLLKQYEKLLQQSDVDLVAWITGKCS